MCFSIGKHQLRRNMLSYTLKIQYLRNQYGQMSKTFYSIPNIFHMFAFANYDTLHAADSE